MFFKFSKLVYQGNEVKLLKNAVKYLYMKEINRFLNKHS